MKILLASIVSVSIGCFMVFNQHQNTKLEEAEKIRKELSRVIAIKSDDEFLFEVFKLAEMELGVRLPIRFGEWYPAAAGAQFQVLKDGSVLLRTKNDERIQVSETAVFFVGEDGNWHHDLRDEHGIAATLTICKEVVILVDIDKGTTMRVARIDGN
jgi:hypothetical protein